MTELFPSLTMPPEAEDDVDNQTSPARRRGMYA
jgi:hypothetical protein